MRRKTKRKERKVCAENGKRVAQNWLPVEDVRSGIIILKDGGYRKMLEVTPVNFKLKTPVEKKAIIMNYKSFLKACNFDMQIIVRSKRSDIEPHLDRITSLYEKEENENIRRMMEGYMDLVKTLAYKRKSVSRRFYIVFPYVPPGGANARNVKFADVVRDLNEKKEKIKEHLKKCGNAVSDPMEGEGVISVLNSFLNNELYCVRKPGICASEKPGLVALMGFEEGE